MSWGSSNDLAWSWSFRRDKASMREAAQSTLLVLTRLENGDVVPLPLLRLKPDPSFSKLMLSSLRHYGQQNLSAWFCLSCASARTSSSNNDTRTRPLRQTESTEGWFVKWMCLQFLEWEKPLKPSVLWVLTLEKAALAVKSLFLDFWLYWMSNCTSQGFHI